MKFVFNSKKKRKEGDPAVPIDWKLGFHIEEKEASAKLLAMRLLRAQSDDQYKIFSPPTRCHLFGSGRMTSPVKQIRLMHMSENPIRVFGINSRLVLKVLTENMHIYVLIEPYMSDEMREALLNAGLPKEYLPSVATED